MLFRSARITFSAFSSCLPGIVDVQFQLLQLYTRTLRLDVEPRRHVVEFVAAQKCYSEKLCLVSANMIVCKALSFCLKEPTVELRNFNDSYTKFSAATTVPFSWASYFALPATATLFMTIKLFGGALLIVCLSITICSTCFTCCKAR